MATIKKIQRKNLGFYIVETLIVTGVLIALLILSLSIWIQSLLMIGMLFAYSLLGILRPRTYPGGKGKIVLEYIAISVLVFAAFLFVNASKF